MMYRVGESVVLSPFFFSFVIVFVHAKHVFFSLFLSLEIMFHTFLCYGVFNFVML